MLLAVLLQLWIFSTDASACSCFPPEVRARTAQDALRLARLAVYGRVIEVDAGGVAKVLVLESFKGPAGGSVIEAGPPAGQCEVLPFALGKRHSCSRSPRP